jgi:hypothetical protein
LAESCVLWDLHAEVATLLKSREALVARGGQEGVVLGGNVLQTSAGGRCVLVDDLFDVLLGHLDGEGVTLDLNIDSLVHIVILENLSSFLARNVDASTGALGDGLDGRTLLSDNSATDGSRNGQGDVLSGANLVGDVLERNSDGVGRASALEHQSAIGSVLHFHLGLAPLVDLSDDLRDRLLQLVPRFEHARVEHDLLRLATGKAHLRLAALRGHARSLNTGGRRGSARRPIAGERNVQAVGRAIGSFADGGRLARPHGGSSRRGGLGTTESREKLLGLRVELVLTLARGLLASSFGRDVGVGSRSVGAGGVLGDVQGRSRGRHRVRSVLVRDLFDLGGVALAGHSRNISAVCSELQWGMRTH